MHILLLHPVASWSLQRIASLCRRHDWRLSIVTIEDSIVGVGCESLHEWIRVPALSDDPAELLRQIGPRRFNAVVAGNEFAVIAADVLAAELGLYHNDIEKIRKSRNKALMREAFAEACIPQPLVIAKVSSLDACQTLNWAEVHFPVIVKPVDMAMSLFVRKCETPAEIEETIGKMFAFKYSRLTNYLFTSEALIEEYAEGPEYSLEAIIDEGRLVRHFLTRKFVSPPPANFETGHISGGELPLQHEATLVQTCERIAACWGMGRGIMHVEFKMTDQDVRIIEAAARPAGDHIPELVEARYGVSIEEAFVRLRAGLKWREPVTAAGDVSLDLPTDWIGIRFSFPERTEAVPSALIDVLEKQVHLDGVLPGADAFSVNRRTGYVVARSKSFDALTSFIDAH